MCMLQRLVIIEEIGNSEMVVSFHTKHNIHMIFIQVCVISYIYMHLYMCMYAYIYICINCVNPSEYWC